MSLKKQRLIYYLIVDAAIMTLFFKNYFVLGLPFFEPFFTVLVFIYHRDGIDHKRSPFL